jgi:polysaccharide biosynthesis transport protein
VVPEVNERWNDESVMRDRLSVLGRQKWVLLAAVIVAPLLAFAVSRGQQRLYEASADVLVNQQSPTAAALNLQTSVSSPPDRYLATQATLARGRPVAQMAVEAANVPHRTAAALLADSAVSANLNADVLTFSVTDHIPIVAQKLATAYATQFTVYRHTLDTKALSAAIVDVDQKLTAIVASGGTGSLLYTRLAAQASDLEALQTVQLAGSSAVLADPASSVSLVQPKTRRNVILGIMVGLALGVALAFFRESLDTRVHSVEELQARLGLPLLGRIPKPDRRLAQAQRLATISDPTGSGNEAFRILKNNLEISQLRHHVGSIVITSTTRGEGKSTAAANLAVILARAGRHVILVDLDLRNPSLDRLFGLRYRPGLTSVAGGRALVDALLPVDVRLDPSMPAERKLEVVTVGPPPPDPGEFLMSSFVPDALAALAGRCDLLLIDTPPVLAVGDAITVATRADALILVAGVTQVRRATLAEARHVLEACPTVKLGFIATGISTTERGARLQSFGLALTRTFTQYARRARQLKEDDEKLAGGEAGQGQAASLFERRPQRVPNA